MLVGDAELGQNTEWTLRLFGLLGWSGRRRFGGLSRSGVGLLRSLGRSRRLLSERAGEEEPGEEKNEENAARGLHRVQCKRLQLWMLLSARRVAENMEIRVTGAGEDGKL